MTSGYQALTLKEKETLRLLVNGYDAKSMARHLGLSVHTVNERLRDARRKMAVSSSREAARLLSDVERQDPEILVPETLGDAPTSNSMEQPRQSVGNSDGSRRAGWIIGGVLMLISLTILAFTSLSGTAQAPARTQNATPAGETVVVLSARRWLALVDTSNWKESWQTTGQTFRKLNTVERWESASATARVPLGAMRSRALVSEEDVPTPPRGNMIVKFRTSFAGKAEAVETVALVREDGDWRVVGYYID